MYTFKTQEEKDAAIKTEIQKIIDAYQKNIRYARQHNVSRTRENELETLGVLQYMPDGFKNGDAQAVIEAAKENRTAVMNRSGEGEELDASTLNQLLNAKVEPEVAPDENTPATTGIGGGDMPNYEQIYHDILNAQEFEQNPDAEDLNYDYIRFNNTSWTTGLVNKQAVKQQFDEYLKSIQRGLQLMETYYIYETTHHQSMALLEKPQNALWSVLMDGYSGQTIHKYWYLCLMRKASAKTK